MKYTRFQDIPQFTPEGPWECDFTLRRAVNYVRTELLPNGLDLDPDFQRGHVWTEAQQIAWVEFFLQGGRTGRVIYFNDPRWMGKPRVRVEPKLGMAIVDGKQRLHAMTRFVDGEIPAFGTLAQDFIDNDRECSNTVKFNINTLPTRRAVLQWYLEMNGGGTPHTEAELDRVRELLRREAKGRDAEKNGERHE